MHRLDHIPTLNPLSHIRLIGHDNQHKACLLQPKDCVGHAGEDLEISQAGWRIRHAVLYEGTVEDTIAVDKNGPLSGHGRAWVVLSHLVSTSCSFGCETRQCQAAA